MTSKRILLVMAMSSGSLAARIKRNIDSMQTESHLEAQYAAQVATHLEAARKAVESLGVQVSRTPSDSEKQEFLDVHNKYRCMHGANKVTWSDAMAESAHNYIAQMTSMAHSASYNIAPPAGPAGENLYMASWAATPSQAVDAWYSEVNDCKGGPTGFTDGCAYGENGAVTGHFTVMVWTGVQEIGCAFSEAKAGLIICRYKAGDQLSLETPNINKPSNYPSHVLTRSKTADQCGASADSGNDGTDTGSDGTDAGSGGSGAGMGDDDGSDTGSDSGAINYRDCVAAGSIESCGQCTHSVQCASGMFCCPYMKKCVANSRTSCYYPVANCHPVCQQSNSVASVSCTTCSDASFPTTWLGRTCGANGGPLPTPEPPTPAPPTPAPPAGSCQDNSGGCPNWKNAGYCAESSPYSSWMAQNCCASCGASGR